LVERQNVLNNSYALTEIQKATQIKGVMFEASTRWTKDQIATYFEVDIRTIERYIEQNKPELEQNGYELIKGKRLKAFIEATRADVTDINVGNISPKTPILGIFDFRAYLNIAMMLTESEKARLLRQAILDIVIDVINQRTGGGTKYINQRDEDFISAWFGEENYRRQFTGALRDCVDMGKLKYSIYTNKIYISIFKEKANEYRKILNLQKSDKVRDTFYSEILDLVASFEYGFAEMLQSECRRLDRKISSREIDILYKAFEKQAHWKPLIDRARNKIASRDLVFRDALHLQLEDYITPLQAGEFERFLGEKSKELAERLEEAKDVFQRLKERE